ncbi:DUF167 domain-containing protein [Rubritalea sp.]|uniref:DUF167 domain-containing protein n=1 Tax=Rubritalea sp. TaxID=2109375 RepID=UPI003EF40E08
MNHVLIDAEFQEVSPSCPRPSPLFPVVEPQAASHPLIQCSYFAKRDVDGKVVDHSTRNEIVGWLGESLKIKVQAPPEKGKANKAVIKLLSKALDVPATHISVISGTTAQQKTVEITSQSLPQVLEKLPVP